MKPNECVRSYLCASCLIFVRGKKGASIHRKACSTANIIGYVFFCGAITCASGLRPEVSAPYFERIHCDHLRYLGGKSRKTYHHPDAVHCALRSFVAYKRRIIRDGIVVTLRVDHAVVVAFRKGMMKSAFRSTWQCVNNVDLDESISTSSSQSIPAQKNELACVEEIDAKVRMSTCKVASKNLSLLKRLETTPTRFICSTTSSSYSSFTSSRLPELSDIEAVLRENEIVKDPSFLHTDTMDSLVNIAPLAMSSPKPAEETSLNVCESVCKELTELNYASISSTQPSMLAAASISEKVTMDDFRRLLNVACRILTLCQMIILTEKTSRVI